MKLFFSKVSQMFEKQNSRPVNKDGEFISFGEDNNYPLYLKDLYDESSLHSSCVDAVVQGIIGKGLTSNNEDVLTAEINSEGETLQDIFNKIALDNYLFGGYALEVIWTNDGTKIAELYHVDFSKVRVCSQDDYGKDIGYYIKDKWERMSWGTKGTEAEYVPAFNEEYSREDKKQLFYHKSYNPTNNVYPIPPYQGGIKAVDVDRSIDDFHLNNLKNGLTPSLAVITYTNASEEERQEINRQLKEQWSGTSNAGNIFYIDVDSPENKPEIIPIPANANDGYYREVNEMMEQKILTAHRITSPSLLGIKQGNGLSNNAEELETAYRLFQVMVIEPLQEKLLAEMNYLTTLMFGTEPNLGIVQIKISNDGTEAIDINREDEAV
jgi:capsid portal protein